MWILLTALGFFGGVLLVLSLIALFMQQRTPPELRTGIAKLPRGLWLGAIVLSLALIFVGMNSTAFLPGPDQQEIEEDIKAFDAEFDDL
jgi:NADH:ubiquinone oxidoreductase subunit 6 (subunit J)